MHLNGHYQATLSLFPSSTLTAQQFCLSFTFSKMNVLSTPLTGQVKLWCLLDGDNFKRRFSVEADYADEIDELKRLIISSGPRSIKDRHVADIILYKINKNQTDIWGFQPDEDAELDLEETIAKVFAGDRPKPNCVHILVRFHGK